MKKIAQLQYLLELSARRSRIPYFEVAESEYEVHSSKFDDVRARIEI